MKNKITTIELLENIIEIGELLSQTNDDEVNSDLQNAYELLIQHLKEKIGRIDKFILGLEEREAKIDASMSIFKKEIDRLRIRKNSITNTKRYLNSILLPAVIREIGIDNKLKTDTANYSIYTAYKVKEWNIDQINKEYIKEQVVHKIDKIKAKKDAIKNMENNKPTNGCVLEKVWRTRRS